MSRVHELARLDRTDLIAVWQRVCQGRSARYAIGSWDRDQLISAICRAEGS